MVYKDKGYAFHNHPNVFLYSPRYSLLGRVPDTELYLETDSYKEVRLPCRHTAHLCVLFMELIIYISVSGQAKAIPGITIFRSSAMLYYANVELYQEALLEKVPHTQPMNYTLD